MVTPGIEAATTIGFIDHYCQTYLIVSYLQRFSQN